MNERGLMVKYIGVGTPSFYGCDSETSLKFIEGDLIHNNNNFLMIPKNGDVTAINLERVEHIKFIYKGD